jgi:acyl-CoA thioester hydrolase
VYECPVRRADLHPGGTVNNVVFVDYLQEARLDLLRRHNTSPSPRPGEGLVVVRTVVDYLSPLRLSQTPLYVATWTTEVRAASFTLGYEIYTLPQGATEPLVHARASTVLTPFVFAEDRPRRLTPEERDRLTPAIEPSPVDDARPTKPPPWVSDGAERRPVHVRFSDVDILGHVNNVKYVDYVLDAQTEYLLGVFREAAVDGHVELVVAHTELDYLGQVNLRPEPYDVWTRVAALGTTSVTFEVEIRDADRVMARGRVVMVNLDPEGGHPVPVPPHHREVFERRRLAGVRD